MPMAFLGDRKPARTPEKMGKSNLSQRDKPPPQGAVGHSNRPFATRPSACFPSGLDKVARFYIRVDYSGAKTFGPIAARPTRTIRYFAELVLHVNFPGC
jgi:hypothetical protein